MRPIRWATLRKVQAHFGRGIQVLLGQAEHVVHDLVGEIPAAVGIEDASVERDPETGHVAFLQHFDTALVALLRVLVRNRPVGLFVARDPEHGGEHVALRKGERVDQDGLIFELTESGAFVVRVLWQDGESEQFGHGAAALGPRGSADLGVAVVDDGEGFLAEVEAVADLLAAKAELVPERAGQSDPVGVLTLGGFLDIFADRDGFFADQSFFGKGEVRQVGAVFIGHDVSDPSLDCGVDESLLEARAGCDTHGDDEHVLTLHCFSQSSDVVLVRFLDRVKAFGEFAGAVGSRDGCHFVLALLDESPGDEAAYVASGLRTVG